MPLSIERTDGSTVSATVNLKSISDIEQIFNVVKSTVETTLGARVDHFALQYSNEKNQFEEAYYDPILGEGSEVRDVVSANQWRVLVLGEVSLVLGNVLPDPDPEKSQPRLEAADQSDAESDDVLETSGHVHL